eukprot:SAG22_NODE_21940_length_252_cov_1.692810_1_plen_53_part_01
MGGTAALLGGQLQLLDREVRRGALRATAMLLLLLAFATAAAAAPARTIFFEKG